MAGGGSGLATRPSHSTQTEVSGGISALQLEHTAICRPTEVCVCVCVCVCSVVWCGGKEMVAIVSQDS